jgi:hypothetical protein
MAQHQQHIMEQNILCAKESHEKKFIINKNMFNTTTRIKQVKLGRVMSYLNKMHLRALQPLDKGTLSYT